MPDNNIYGNDLVYKKPDNNCLLVCGHVPARLVLYMLSWSGFLVSFMMRTDINLAIVAMVATNNAPPNVTTHTSGDQQEEQYCYDVEAARNQTNQTGNNYDGTLDWSPHVQSYVLASFYWAYIVSQVIGGYATQKLGTKRVFGYAQLATALCSLCIPVASVTHYGFVIALRSVQGFASGLTWPAMYALVGHWIPTPERSRFMSSFQGFSIGIGVTYPLCGVLIAHLGWRSVFYTTGTVGVVWCIFWYLLAFDSPESHPRITESEMRYIQENTVNTFATSKSRRVPWAAILRSMPAWAIGITTFGRIWVHYTFIIPGPMYMKSVMGFSIQENGLLSGAPFICSYLSSVVFCYIADKLVTGGYMTLTAVRKMFTALAQVVPGLLCLLIGYMGCSVTMALVVWFVAVTLITAAYAGAMANVVDIAPNFAGPVLAFAQTIHMTASFLSPLAAGYLTQDGHTLAAWRYVFGVSAIVAIATYSVYQIWGTGEIQPWNYPDGESNGAESELMIEKNSTVVIKNATGTELVDNDDNIKVDKCKATMPA